MENKKKVYLAGWDVFRPDSIEFGKKLKEHCEKNDLIGLYPLDNELPKDLKTGSEIAAWIYQANVSLIEEADIIMANMNNFRGAEPDSGTCFEIGYAQALRKPVYYYMNSTANMVDRFQAETPEYASTNPLVDKDGYAIENFGLPLNLMVGASSQAFEGNAFECIEKIAQDLKNEKKIKPRM